LSGRDLGFPAVVGVVGGTSVIKTGDLVEVESITCDFTGRTVVVTGGARGIGRALSRFFAQSGATLAIADVDAEALAAVATELDGVIALEQLRAEIPMGRFSAPSEASPAVGFLASEEAGYITGVVLPVDGGLSIRQSRARSFTTRADAGSSVVRHVAPPRRPEPAHGGAGHVDITSNTSAV